MLYYTLYCLAGIIMFEEVLQFTDYLSIFVQAKVYHFVVFAFTI